MLTLGCKVNRAESEDIAEALLDGGVELVAEDLAEVVIVNTCTVTGEADAKARKAVRRALAASAAPVVVVTGCLAAVDASGLAALGNHVVVEPEKSLVASRVAALLGADSTAGASHAAARRGAHTGGEFRTRVPLKVQDGCDAYCAYCIVPHARGGPRSVALAEAVARAGVLVAGGSREIVVTGINLGRYSDPQSGADLSTLVRALAETGIARLRLSSIEPLDLTPRLLAALAETGAACPHLHVPLQSGSDRVLSAMGRGYSVRQFLDRLEAAREAIPGLAVTTDVIAGFPGESDDDFAETVSACRSAAFAKLHVFRYSPRLGTPAAEMPSQVVPEERAARARVLRELGGELRAAYVASRRDSVDDVLVETVRSGTAEGTTPDYLRVRFPADTVSAGDIVRAPLVSAV